MTTVLTPVDRGTATQAGPRIYRKQLLRKGTIHYPEKNGTRRTVVFDDAYMAALAASFNAGAYDDVPFVLADEQNRHTMDPTRFHGWLKGVEVTPDGIDGLVELSAAAVELVERTGRKLGVSARIKPVEHLDGRTYPLAINHVLGTLDGRMQGPEHRLNPWEPIDLSDPTDDVLDLSGATYTEGTTMPRINLADLEDTDYDALASFAAANGIELSTPDDEGDEGDDPDDGTGDDGDDGTPAEEDGDDASDEVTTEELDAMIDAELAEIAASAEPVLSLSAADDPEADTIDLSAGLVAESDTTAQAERRESALLRFQIASRDYLAAGVPPHLIDLAEPVLSLSDDDAQTLDLASPATGDTIDVRGIVRDMLDAVKGTINLSREDGYGHETEAAEQEDAATAAWHAHLDNN